MNRKNAVIPIAAILWGFLYFNLEVITNFLVYDLAGLEKGLHFTLAVHFFIFEVPKVLLLLTIVVFIVGIIRTYFSPERTRKMLGGKKEFVWLENCFDLCSNRFIYRDNSRVYYW